MSNEVGDLFAARKGIDDITAVVGFLKFSDEEINLRDPYNQIIALRDNGV